MKILNVGFTLSLIFHLTSAQLWDIHLGGDQKPLRLAVKQGAPSEDAFRGKKTKLAVVAAAAACKISSLMTLKVSSLFVKAEKVGIGLVAGAALAIKALKLKFGFIKLKILAKKVIVPLAKGAALFAVFEPFIDEEIETLTCLISGGDCETELMVPHLEKKLCEAPLYCKEDSKEDSSSYKGDSKISIADIKKERRLQHMPSLLDRLFPSVFPEDINTPIISDTFRDWFNLKGEVNYLGEPRVSMQKTVVQVPTDLPQEIEELLFSLRGAVGQTDGVIEDLLQLQELSSNEFLSLGSYLRTGLSVDAVTLADMTRTEVQEVLDNFGGSILEVTLDRAQSSLVAL